MKIFEYYLSCSAFKTFRFFSPKISFRNIFCLNVRILKSLVTTSDGSLKLLNMDSYLLQSSVRLIFQYPFLKHKYE